MSSNNYEESDYGLNLDLLIVMYDTRRVFHLLWEAGWLDK